MVDLLEDVYFPLDSDQIVLFPDPGLFEDLDGYFFTGFDMECLLDLPEAALSQGSQYDVLFFVIFQLLRV